MALTELSVFRSNALLAQAIRPLAIWDTTPITMIGSSAMIGLRKITSSRTRIRPTVAIAMMASARLPDFCESSA